MFKKLFTLLIVVGFTLSLLLSLTVAVSADDQSTRGGRFAEKREQIAQKRQELVQRAQEKREEIQSRIATRQANIKERVINNIKRIFGQILDRMMAALNRLDKIVARIESRIAKLKTRGVNTTAAEAALAACADEKTAAAGAINDAKSKVAALDPASVTVRDAVQQANGSVRLAKRAVQDYHKCLVNVIRTLRASVPKEATGSAATESAD